LLKPGRQYEEAVKAFEPYDRVKEENPEARAARRALITEGKAAGPNAISTITAMVELVGWLRTEAANKLRFGLRLYCRRDAHLEGIGEYVLD